MAQGGSHMTYCCVKERVEICHDASDQNWSMEKINNGDC